MCVTLSFLLHVLPLLIPHLKGILSAPMDEMVTVMTRWDILTLFMCKELILSASSMLDNVIEIVAHTHQILILKLDNLLVWYKNMTCRQRLT